MNTAATAIAPVDGARRALRLLRAAGACWFAAALFGQFAFAAYVALNYGGDAAAGHAERWNETLMNGLKGGDLFGNAVLAAHLALAAVISLGGPLQLIPQLRAWSPAFHRWNGRAYIVTAAAMALGGIWMTWSRGVLGGLVNQVGITLNGALILAFAAMTIRDAMARRLRTHQRWAMRLFLAVSGVWFFRIGLMAWIVANRGPVGVGEQLDGPFAVTLGYSQYLLPLAVYELYRRTAEAGGAAARYGVAALMGALALLTAGGSAAAIGLMWLPRLG